MPHKLNRSRAFTLVEILIVVMILGILAAIVIPRFTTASNEARTNALRSEMQNLRKVVALFKEQHGRLPDLVPDWDEFTQQTTTAGKTYGPYLHRMPRNMRNGRSNVVDGVPGTAASAPAGFVYDYNGGNGSGRIGATETDGVAPFIEAP
jgi:general secretion pathway protein G